MRAYVGYLFVRSAVLSFRPNERCRYAAKSKNSYGEYKDGVHRHRLLRVNEWAGYAPSKETAPQKGGRSYEDWSGISSAHHAPRFECESPAHRIDCRGGDHSAAMARTSVASALPALTLSVAKAALVEAWTIPAIVKAKRDVLDRRKCFDRPIGTHRRAQWRRLGTARHESACCQDGRRRSKRQKKTLHNIDPPWIETLPVVQVVDQRGARACRSV